MHSNIDKKINSSLSVDSVIFGFDGKSLKVLLVERTTSINGREVKDYKLPGRMIFENESLDISAAKIFHTMTGDRIISPKQFRIFSDPERVSKEELEWINKFHGINTDRVVTVGYYGLVKLNMSLIAYTREQGAHWEQIDNITHLAMDHKEILRTALSTLQRDVAQSPIAFHMLPKKFTIRQLQTLFSAILGIEIDNRNFRKKILNLPFIKATGEKEKNVKHKPAEYYTFKERAFKRAEKAKQNLRFINNWSY